MQAQKLKEALEARKAKRRQLMDKVAKEKEDKVISMFKNNANTKVKAMSSEDKAKDLANRIKAGFNKNESVQVTENYLDQKN